MEVSFFPLLEKDVTNMKSMIIKITPMLLSQNWRYWRDLMVFNIDRLDETHEWSVSRDPKFPK